MLPELNELKDRRKRLQEPGVVGAGVLERLRCVPGLILNCWSYPETSTKHLVLNLLQEYLLPKSDRASANMELMEVSEDSEEAPAPRVPSPRVKALLPRRAHSKTQLTWNPVAVTPPPASPGNPVRGRKADAQQHPELQAQGAP